MTSNEAKKLIARFDRMTNATTRSFERALSDTMKAVNAGRVTMKDGNAVLRASGKALKRFDAALKREEIAFRNELRRKAGL